MATAEYLRITATPKGAVGVTHHSQLTQIVGKKNVCANVYDFLRKCLDSMNSNFEKLFGRTRCEKSSPTSSNLAISFLCWDDCDNTMWGDIGVCGYHARGLMLIIWR